MGANLAIIIIFNKIYIAKNRVSWSECRLIKEKPPIGLLLTVLGCSGIGYLPLF